MKLSVLALSLCAASAAAHKPFYHLESPGRLNPICYEMTYSDAHLRSEGFKIGSCSSDYTVDLGHETSKICDGHSEVNIQDCTTEVIDVVTYKLGKKAAAVEPELASDRRSLQHKTLYHLVAEMEPLCYETTYIDDHFRENGFVIGTCDETFNKILEHDDETICNGHSEKNVKYCQGDTITIDILKLGQQAEEVEATDPPHKPLFHLIAEQEAVCYETTYSDEHFRENGFVPGTCDESFNIQLEKDPETICNGHSEENLKYCPGDEITIDILKLGKATEETVRRSLQHKPLFYLIAEQEAVCYETTYSDEHFRENGFLPGTCDESFNTVLSKDDETVCNGHSEENVKYCPGETVTIEVLKLGKAAAVEATDPPHKPLFYLVAEQEAVCYETTYSDEHFRENGFLPGSCDESFNTVLSKDDETVCNGHSEENLKYCPGDEITIEILKFGKAQE